MHFRLIPISILLFLKYYILGSAYTTMGLVLGTHGLGAYIGASYSVGGFTSLFAGMFIGEIADRFMLPNKLLFFCHLVSGVALLLIPSQIAAGSAWGFLALLAINTTFGDATVPICSRIAFYTLKDNVRDYAITRSMGTIGWMVAGLVVGFSGLSSSTRVFEIASASSFVMALFVLTLPPTPSAARGTPFSLSGLIGWDALVMMRERSFAIFMIVAVTIFLPMSAYNAYLPVYLEDKHVANVGGFMTLAQVSEILLMFSLAFFIRWLGIRKILAVACGAWAGIMALFTLADRGPFALIVAGIILHGVGWDFFYASSEVYLNGKSTEQLKARGQALLRTATFGLGTILGGLLTGFLYNALEAAHVSGARGPWLLFWSTTGIIPAVLLVIVLKMFREAPAAPIAELDAVIIPPEPQGAL